MARLQNKKGIEIVKKTLSLNAPTGGVQKASADSTAFFRERGQALIKELDKYQSDWAKTYGRMDELPSDPSWKAIINRIGKNAQDQERQRNKGKEGFDKDGNPVKKTMGSIAEKKSGK